MRQFVAETELKDNCLTVTGKNFHYLVNVLRVSVGDMIYVRLLDSSLIPMTVSKIDSKNKCAILQKADVTNEAKMNLAQNQGKPLETKNNLEITLFLFVSKPAKMDLIIRQATECGVNRIIPIFGEFSQGGSIESAAKKSDGKDERWQRIITEACEQSGSPIRTKIEKGVFLKDALKIYSEDLKKSINIVLYELSENTKSIYKIIKNTENINDIPIKACIAVGSEGGISVQELKMLAENNFTPVHFNTNILRCETAALYGISALQTAILEKSEWL